MTNKEQESYEEFEVYATYYIEEKDPSRTIVTDIEEEFAGTLNLRKVLSAPADMPQELEINGVVYKPQF